MNIVIIGTGNVAFHLIKGFYTVESITLFLQGRNTQDVSDLKTQFPHIQIHTSLNLIETKADLVLICVKDDVLNDVFLQYTYPVKAVVAHTSGSQKITVNPNHTSLAIFYPLQTFSKKIPLNWFKTPVLIEAFSPDAYLILEKAAGILGAPFFETNEHQRSRIHLAAVITSNFINHLIGKAEQLLHTDDIDYHILQPLIEETIRKAFVNHPFNVQTGPAIRNDQSILQKHLQQLSRDIILQKIYTDITESIRKTGNLDSINK
jgi:predicted short-subunit dehydrogenase-like oxidoreductase (DUF2520 family)